MLAHCTYKALLVVTKRAVTSKRSALDVFTMPGWNKIVKSHRGWGLLQKLIARLFSAMFMHALLPKRLIEVLLTQKFKGKTLDASIESN